MVKKDFLSLRTNCMSAVIQNDNGGGIHAAEWWNGEGIDFTFDFKENSNIMTKRIELHIDEIVNLVTIAIAMGFIDIEECTKNAKKMKKENARSQRTIKKLSSEIRS